MKEQKWRRRERKYKKRRFGMVVDGKSVFTIRDEMYKRNKKKRDKKRLRESEE